MLSLSEKRFHSTLCFLHNIQHIIATPSQEQSVFCVSGDKQPGHSRCDIFLLIISFHLNRKRRIEHIKFQLHVAFALLFLQMHCLFRDCCCVLFFNTIHAVRCVLIDATVRHCAEVRFLFQNRLYRDCSARNPAWVRKARLLTGVEVIKAAMWCTIQFGFAKLWRGATFRVLYPSLTLP